MSGKAITLLVGALFVSPMAAFADGGLSSSMSAYEQVQQLRHDADALIEKEPSAANVRQAIGLLGRALNILDEPQNIDFAEGDVYLQFRRFDVHRDLAADYARLNDRDAALGHLEAMSKVGTMAGAIELTMKEAPALKVLETEPRFQRLLSEEASVRRLWQHPEIAVAYSATLTPEQRLAGLSLFWSEVNYNFVYFDHVPDVDWDRTYLDFIPRVLAAQTTQDYYAVLMRLAPMLRDGHTNIYPPKELDDRFYARPPLRTELVDGHVLVLQVRSPTLQSRGIHVGDEIVAVDGHPVRPYAEQQVRPLQSSSTAQDAEVRMYTYALLAGDADKAVALTLRDARGREHELSVRRSGYTDVQRPARPFYGDLGGGVAYVRLDNFESDAVVKSFQKVLSEILKARALVIDVRDNGGGSTNFGLEILSYLSAAPIATTASRTRKYLPLQRADGAATTVWANVAGEPYQSHHDRIFNGPVAVLIGPRTFSAGEDFVASFQLMQRGKLIGAATGGSTGQPLFINLPGGGTARICIKRDEYPDGREFVGKGIEPDIAVAETIADVRAGRDPVIERARAELLKRAR
jgi:C-terminal processing protease CtpA/Prc